MTPMNRTPGARNATLRTFSLSPPAQFLAVGGVLLLGLIALSAGLTGGVSKPGVLLAAGFYVLALVLALRALRGYPHATIGLCNVVTVLRLMLVAGLVAALVSPAVGPWPIFGIASVAFLLDGVDGRLARRDGYVSEFGAKFDIEVDAVLALVLAIHAYLGGHAGALVLFLGLPRYIFWGAQFKMPWLAAELPARFSRKLVCVVQIAVLIAVLAPVFDRPFTDVLAGFAAVALIWSFGRDVRWLWRARK